MTLPSLLRPTLLVLAGVLVLPVVPASRAHAEDVDAALTWNEKGLALNKDGRYEEAIAAFEKAEKLAPDDAVVRRNVALTRANWGVALLKEGKATAAEEQTRLALARLPDDPVIRVNLAECLDFRGYPDKAAVEVRRAAKKGAEVASVQRKLGAVNYREGRLAEAVAAWTKALELQPGHEDTTSRLARAKASLDLEKRLSYDISSNFTIYFEMEKHAVLASLVLRELEEAHQVVQAELQSTARERLKVVLLSTEEFRETTGAHTWVAGLFDGQIRLPVKDAGERHEDLLRRARHEYVHAVLAKLGRRAPSWLHEGLAQVHEGRAADEARRRLAAASQRLPYEELTTSFASTAAAGKARQQYDSALAFTAWLREGERRSGFRAAMQALFEDASLEEAFGNAYGEKLPQLYARFLLTLAN